MTIDKEQAKQLLSLTSASTRRGPMPRYSKEVAAARQKEKKDRTGKAWISAARAMRTLHPDEWDMLYETAVEQINFERGPLPGDEQE